MTTYLLIDADAETVTITQGTPLVIPANVTALSELDGLTDTQVQQVARKLRYRLTRKRWEIPANLDQVVEDCWSEVNSTVVVDPQRVQEITDETNAIFRKYI